MDRKTLTIILGTSLIGCFLLPFFKSASGDSTITAFDYVFRNPFVDSEKYLWLLIPVSGFLLLVGALNNEQYIPNRGILIWLPLLTLVFFFIKLYIDNKSIGRPVGLTEFAGMFAMGYWIAMGMALLLAFARPKAS